MTTRDVRPQPSAIEAELRATDHRTKLALLIVSLLTAAALGWAALDENLLPEWRGHQQDYAELLEQRATDDLGRKLAEDFRIELRQVVLPELDSIDRCVSCHNGLEDPRMADAPLPHRSHPGEILQQHEVARFGCVVCHDGQGRALTRDAAHGQVPHWHGQRVSGERVYANCSRCHPEGDAYGASAERHALAAEPAPMYQSELAAQLPGDASHAGAVAWGKQLFLEKDCLGCHRYNGRGGQLGPELSQLGDKLVLDFDFAHVHGERSVAAWLMEHFADPQAVSPGSLMPDPELSERQAWALTLYMLAQQDKPLPDGYHVLPASPDGPLASGQQLYEMYCRACHGPDGQGSTARGDWEAVALRTPQQLWVPSLGNADTLDVASEGYLAAILASGRPGTTMGRWLSSKADGLRADEIRSLVAHLQSWRSEAMAVWQPQASAGDALAGLTAYRQHCVSCHGFDGEGGIGVSLSAPSALAVASDDFLAAAIIHGRPDTAMPAWRDFDRQEISDLLAGLRSWQGTAAERSSALLLARGGSDQASAAFGASIYGPSCTVCHGADGQGDIGPSISGSEFLALVDDEYLFDALALGRPGTGMPAWRHLSGADIASLIMHLRSWQRAASRQPLAPAAGDAGLGRDIFADTCVGCHGPRAEGGSGPQLGSPVLLASASDAMLREWILYGRSDTAMLGFARDQQGMAELSPQQADHVVAYLRSLQDEPWLAPAKNPSGAPQAGRVLFQEACAGCHGTQGEGLTGPALSNPGLLSAASDGFFLATMSLGRDNSEMRPVKQGPQSLVSFDAEQLDDVLAWLRWWEVHPPQAQRYVVPEDPSAGAAAYLANCAGCHGSEGKGGVEGPALQAAWAPQLNNKGFLDAASDGFLQATIIRGRSGTAMRAFGPGTQGIADLSSSQIESIVAHIRTWSDQADRPRKAIAKK